MREWYPNCKAAALCSREIVPKGVQVAGRTHEQLTNEQVRQIISNYLNSLLQSCYDSTDDLKQDGAALDNVVAGERRETAPRNEPI